MRRTFASPILFGIIGLAIIGTAVLADRLGLDPSPGWGSRRISLFILGACTVLGAALYWRYSAEASKQLSKLWSPLRNLPIVKGIREHPRLIYVSSLIRNYWITAPLLILVFLIYVWFVSAGTWTTWTSPTHLYADLARGFLRGNLSLAMKVNPQLPASPDPNDVSKAVKGPLDVSYFKGRYYLYWGPVPALILVLVHPMISGRVGDLQVLFGFLVGLWTLQCVLVIAVWDRFFSHLPRYLLWLSILLVGLAGPAAYMLDYTRSARIYEAAVTGGQFFLIGGFMAAAAALGPPVRRGSLAIAGTLWALAMATRLILALPIGFMVLMLAWWVLVADHRWLKQITALIPLVLPLAVAIVCLGWYNWARFGSITETGYYYQLAITSHWQKIYGGIFAPIFIPQNLYNYLVFPFRTQSQFPYIYPTYGSNQPIFASYALPSFYFSQKMTGLVYSLPFMAFAAIAVIAAFKWLRNRGAHKETPGSDPGRVLNWITLTLGGSSLVTFGILLTFFWAAMRYMEEVVPALVTLAVIGFWQGYLQVMHRPVWKTLYAGVGVALALVSILISTLLGLSVNQARFPIIALLASTK